MIFIVKNLLRKFYQLEYIYFGVTNFFITNTNCTEKL